jgi:hypothetical protein
MHDSNSAATTASVVGRGSPLRSGIFITTIALAFIVAVPGIALADEGGVSFWIPGLFGSLAAVPQQAPGWSGTSIYYHDSVSAGGNVALAREFELGRIPANFTGTASANVNASVNFDLFAITYTFATPVLGAQASFGFLSAYGANSTSLAGTLAGTVTGPLGGAVPFSRSDAINSTIVAFGDILPMFQLKWNAGVNNYMFYVTGDMPAGAYDSMRLANIATPISTKRPGTKLRRCSDSRTTSSTRPLNIRMASTCTSTGACRNS